MSYLLVAFSVNFSSPSSLAVGAICRSPTVVVKILNYMLRSRTRATQARMWRQNQQTQPLLPAVLLLRSIHRHRHGRVPNTARGQTSVAKRRRIQTQIVHVTAPNSGPSTRTRTSSSTGIALPEPVDPAIKHIGAAFAACSSICTPCFIFSFAPESCHEYPITCSSSPVSGL